MPRLIYDRCDFLSGLVRGKNVLDIGCVEHSFENSVKRGSRWLHKRIKDNAASVLGLDYEEEEVVKMQQAGYNVIQADAENFDLNQTYDIVMAGELLEHLSNPGKFLTCARRHLKPDGRLVLTTPNANCLIYFLENLILGHEIDNIDHVAIYSPTTISQLLQRHGLVVEKHLFLAENTSFHHQALTAKILTNIKQALQVTLGFLQPSLCHHMITVARLNER